MTNKSALFTLKYILPFLLLIIASILLSFLLLEKIIRYATPQLTFSQAKIVSLKVSKESDLLPSELQPNTETLHIANTHEFSYPVKINSLGYRMEEFDYLKPENEYRILMIGDSLTFGYGVEEKFNIPSTLKENLNNYLKENNLTNKKIQIINAGFASWRSPDSYYLYLKKKGLDLDPDLIIVNYFMNNDIMDLDETVWERIDFSGLPEKISSKISYVDENYTRLKDPFQDWKYVIPVLRESHLWILFATVMETKSPNYVTYVKSRLGLAEKLPMISQRENEVCLYQEKCSQKMNELIERFFTLVSATKKLSTDKNIPIIVSLLPSNPQVNNLAEQQKAGRLTQTEMALIQPQRKIKSYLDQNQIEYIDPLEYVVDEKSSTYYYHNDGHPTKAGYERLSQATYDFLTKEWLIAQKLKPN